MAPTSNELWKLLHNVSDRITHLEPVVQALKERGDKHEARLEDFERESRKRWDEHREQLHDIRIEVNTKIEKLESDQRVNATKQAIYFGILAFLGATIGGLVIKSGFDNMVSRISHIQASKP